MEQDNNATIGMMRNEKTDMTVYLLSAFQMGDMSAFSQLYDLHINILFNYGRKLTSDKELLKDCIHDIFVKIYTKRNELGCIDNFKSYLFISLKNKLCDELRKRMYMSGTAVEDLEPVSSYDVEDRYLAEEKRNWEGRMVDSLLNQLSPRQREAITLYYIEEKRYEDICEIMDMNYQSVRNLMHRGLSKLRTIAG